MAKWSLRRIIPFAAAGCAALVGGKAVRRRRTIARAGLAEDPADRHLAEDMMDALATGEGMPEARGG